MKQTRRSFLAKAALAGPVAVAFPYIAKGLGEDPSILGHGNQRYRVVKGWGVLESDKIPVKDCHEMIMDRKGRIFLLTNETRNNIIIYNKDGRALATWGTEYPGAHGLTRWDANGEEFLFICDYERHVVHKTTLDGKVVMSLGYPEETGLYDEEAKFKPTETAVAPNGDIYVADGYGEQWIFHYNSKGELLRYFGGRGVGGDKFQCAHGVCVDLRDKKSPTLIICERIENCFKRFTLDGKLVSTIPLPGAYLSRPAIFGDYLYSAVLISKMPWESKSGFVTIVDKNDKCVSNPGGSEPVYADGKLGALSQVGSTFMSPHDVLVDDDESLYVAQWNSLKTYPVKLERV
jgi:hypothetical protein